MSAATSGGRSRTATVEERLGQAVRTEKKRLGLSAAQLLRKAGL